MVSKTYAKQRIKDLFDKGIKRGARINYIERGGELSGKIRKIYLNENNDICIELYNGKILIKRIKEPKQNPPIKRKPVKQPETSPKEEVKRDVVRRLRERFGDEVIINTKYL